MTLLWTTAVLAPLLTVLAIMVVGLRRSDPAGDRNRAWLTWIAPWTTLPALGLALAGPSAGRVELPGLLLGTTMTVDGLARPLLLIVVVVFLAALWTTAARRTRLGPRLSAVLLVCYLGTAGTLVAADAVTFYLSFAVVSLVAYGLVVHTGTPEARHAAIVYLVLTVVSEVLVLVALMFVVTGGGRLLADAPAAVAESPYTTLTVVLLLLGFGIKAGTVPFHVWVPPAHSSAPSSASPVLSGLLVMVGIVGMIRFLPLGEAQLSGLGGTLVVLGLVAMFLAVPAAVLQDDPKVVLAYSTISQLGLLNLLIGAALREPQVAPACAVAAVLYATHHGLAKAALFLSAPLWNAHGAVRGWVAVASGVAALSIAGAPLTAGFVAKYAAKQAVADLPGLEMALTVLGAASTVIVARALWLLHHHPISPEKDISVEDEPGPLSRFHGGGQEAAAQAHPAHTSGAALTAWSVLAVAAAVAPVLVAPAWLPAAETPSLTWEAIWPATWPVLLGLVLSVTAWWLAGRVPWIADPPVVPAGDVLVPAEAVARGALDAGEGGVAAVTTRYRAVRDRTAAAFDTVSPAVAAEHGESRLGPWRASGAALLVTAAVVLLVGWLS